MKFAVIYVSYGGNTKDLAYYITKRLEEYGQLVHTFSYRDEFNLDDYDYVLLGSLTWVDGKLPSQMRKLLKKILIENKVRVDHFSLFGTGETQWGEELFCRGVDEMNYHIKKYNKNVHHLLKIEQNPLGKESKIDNYIDNIMKEVMTIEINTSKTV